MPRKAVLTWLDDCLAVEARHAENLDLQKAATRRLAVLPPRGDAKDDAATLWAVVLPARPRFEEPEEPVVDPPTAQIGRLLRLARSFGG